MAITLRRLVGLLGYEIDPKASAAIKQYAKMGTDAQKQVAGAVRDANGRLRDSRGKFLSMGKGADAANGSVGGLVSSLGGLKGIAVGVIGGLVVGAMKSLVGATFDANQEFESLKTRLETLLGPEKAVAKFAELERFAAETPYQLNEMTDAFIRLEGAGFDASDANLRALGDLAAASGKSMDELVNAILSSGRGLGNMVDNFQGLAAKAAGGRLEMERFDRATGEVVRKLVDPKNKKDLLQFWLEGGQAEGIKGGMERLSKTLGGLQSTLKDNIAAFFREVGKAGFNDAVRELLMVLIQGAPDATTAAQALGKMLASLIRDFTRLVKWVNTSAVPVFGRLSVAVRDNVAPIMQVAKALALLALPAGFVFLLLEDLYTYLSGGDSLIGDALGGLESAGGNFTLLAQAIKGGLQALKGFGLQLAAIFSGQAVGGPLGTFVNLVRSVFGMLRSEGPSSLQTLFTFARPLLDNLARIFLQVRGVVVRVFDAFTTVAAPAFRLLWAVAKPILKLLILWFGFIGFATLTLWGLIWDNFLSPLLDGLAELLGFVARVAAGWMELWVPAFETIYGWVEKLIDAVFELLGIDLGPLNKLFGAVDAAFGVDGGGAKAQTAPLLAAGAGGGKGAINAPTTVGSVTVQVQGTTDMGPAQLAAATEAGVRKGLPPAQNLRNIQ